MSLETAVAELTAAVKENSGYLQQVIAGQQAALDKVDAGAGKAPAKAKAAAKPAETPAAAAADPAPAAEAVRVVTDADLKTFAGKWMGGKSEAERNAAVAQVNSFMEHIGKKGQPITGDKATLDDDQRKQALFFMTRWNGGLEVDFSADYDFDADPLTQGAPAAEAEAENPFG